jgi:hypothetical protein
VKEEENHLKTLSINDQFNMNSSLLEAKDFGENKRKESDAEGSELELYQLSDD